ncbi:hypothetical protein [Frigoriglobus tundricola]|uniref:Uncharacterized protein n=1 Tax=Frigoriglobus tundricola TaxID=2774151 RepID=A0A6M5Z2X1_9BACT|nr:hypothetical protein [Frigoriglobus tundricola]QJX00077.1 hypothetical protein FTUN_7701 [Frigoriglobus tundricola]
MPHDLPLLLICAVPSALVGLGIGVALRRYRPRLCERYAAWSSALPWWFFLAGAAFFVSFAGWQVVRGRLLFAAVFATGAALDLVATGVAVGRRMSSGGGTKTAEPGAAPDRCT